MQSKQFYTIFTLEENYELCTSLSVCILLKLTLTLYMLFCFVSLCLVLILNKGTRNATFFKGKNIWEATSTRPNTTVVLFHFNNISYLVGALIWANKVITLCVYCPIRTFLAKILQPTLLMGCFVRAAAQEEKEGLQRVIVSPSCQGLQSGGAVASGACAHSNQCFSEPTSGPDPPSVPETGTLFFSSELNSESSHQKE